MTEAMAGDVFTRSRRLGSQKFAGVLEQGLREGEQVLLVDDCDAEIFEIAQPSPKSGLVALLSNKRLLLLRGRGVLGPKRPWVMELAGLEQLGITAEGNLNLRFVDANGEPQLWKLVFRDAILAEQWMRELDGACGPDASDEDLLPRLHECLDGLAPLAEPGQVGRPFAAGAGLEFAIERIQGHLRNAGEVRSCDRMAIVELLIRQFRAPGNLWALWEERDDVALEIFAWHCVARLRLATAGIMSPLPNGAGGPDPSSS